MGAAEKLPEAIEAAEGGALFNCSGRYFVDVVSKSPGFPEPIKLRPLTWLEPEVRQWRDFNPASRRVRRLRRCNKA